MSDSRKNYTTEPDVVQMGFGKVLALDSYCGCCADWFEVDTSCHWARLPAGSPQRGALWRHYKGGLYVVLGYSARPICLEPHLATPPGCRPLKNTFIPLVVYLSVATGAVWVRDLPEWPEEVEVGGTKMPRFQHFSGGEG